MELVPSTLPWHTLVEISEPSLSGTPLAHVRFAGFDLRVTVRLALVAPVRGGRADVAGARAGTVRLARRPVAPGHLNAVDVRVKSPFVHSVCV